MLTAALFQIVQIISLVASALVLAKLVVTGLYRRYHIFSLYFLFRIPDGLCPLFLNINSPRYFYFWILTEPLIWIFQTAVVLELYRLVLAGHKGLYSLGRWVMYGGMVFSVAVSTLSLLPKLKNAGALQSRTIGYYLAAERGVTLGLAILLLVLIFFLTRYPIPMSRNLVVHVGIFVTFFFSNFLVFLLRSFFGLTVNTQTNLLASVVSTICVFGWFFFLTPKGEDVPANLPSFGADYERRALQQLDALNATLLKTARR